MGAVAFAPAKINLFLHVGGPGDDGYHPLCSLMVFADVGDRVTLAAAEAITAVVHGPFAAELAAEPDNLILRAARAFLAAARRPLAPVRLSLEKALPVAAGLGGGSSDAGAVLRLMRSALGVEMSDNQLQAIAAGLGADGAACLWGRPALAQGRGEQLSPAPDLPVLDAVLVNPGVAVSTAQVYRTFDAGAAFGDVAAPVLPPAFEDAAETAAWLARQRNDLESSAVALAPEIGDVLETLAGEPETLLARMSGSGATVFALCAGDVEAQGLAERIAAMAPRWWVRRCRLGGPWPEDL